MEKRVFQLKEMYDSGIDFSKFLKLILHSTDGHSEPTSAYANNKTIQEWLDVYNQQHTELGVDNAQLELFFAYVTKYFHHFFDRNNDKFGVNKYFNREEKSEDKFQIEKAAFIAFEIQ